MHTGATFLCAKILGSVGHFLGHRMIEIKANKPTCPYVLRLVRGIHE